MTEDSSRWDPEQRPAPPSPQMEGEKVESSDAIAPMSRSFSSESLDPSSELHAIVGAGTAFHGTLSFSGHVRIDGEFSGKALGGQLLVIGDGARISGELRARKVIVLGGLIEANIFAEESIELYIPALVSGDLQSPQIYMDKGIQFQGTCDMTGASTSR